MNAVKRFFEDDYNACLAWIVLSVVVTVIVVYW